MEERRYTGAVGSKFYEDGQVRRFAGNTIVSMLPSSGTAFGEALWAQGEAMRLPFARKYAFLPPASFHMTVFELLCDEAREPERWSRLLPVSAPLEEADVLIAERAAAVRPPERIVMRFERIELGWAASIRLVPADDAVAAGLRRYRDELAVATGIRFPNHDEYGFHCSLGYVIEELAAEEREQADALARAVADRLSGTMREVELPTPRVRFFDSMHAFHADRTRTVRWARGESGAGR